MKAILLSRVSDESQKEGYSLDAQLYRLQVYSAARSLDVVEVFQFDETAHKDRRKKFDEVLSRVKKSREPIALVVDKVDRLMRSFYYLNEIESLRASGQLYLHSVSENQIWHKDSSAAELFIFHVMIAGAKMYSDAIRDNIKRSYAQMLRQGRWYGQVPWGYYWTSEHGQKTIKLDPEKAPALRKMFELYDSGEYTFEMLASWFTKHKYYSKYGKPFSKNTIYDMIHHPWYAGYMVASDGTVYRHSYERAIPEHLWQSCQRFKKRNHKVETPFALSGIIRCGHCQALCSPYRQKMYVYLRCTNCLKSHLSERKIIEHISSQIGRLDLSEAQIRDYATRLAEQASAMYDNARAEATRLAAERKRLELRKDALLDLRLDNEISSEDYTKKLDKLKEDLYGIDKQLEGLTVKNFNTHDFISAITHVSLSVRAIFLGSSSENKARFLKTVISQVTLSGKDVSANFKKPLDTLLKVNSGANNSPWWSLADLSRTFDDLVKLSQTLSELNLPDFAPVFSVGGKNGRMDKTASKNLGARHA